MARAMGLSQHRLELYVGEAPLGMLALNCEPDMRDESLAVAGPALGVGGRSRSDDPREANQIGPHRRRRTRPRHGGVRRYRLDGNDRRRRRPDCLRQGETWPNEGAQDRNAQAFSIGLESPDLLSRKCSHETAVGTEVARPDRKVRRQQAPELARKSSPADAALDLVTESTLEGDDGERGAQLRRARCALDVETEGALQDCGAEAVRPRQGLELRCRLRLQPERVRDEPDVTDLAPLCRQRLAAKLGNDGAAAGGRQLEPAPLFDDGAFGQKNAD